MLYNNQREQKIAENMRNMPKMVEEYRQKRREFRRAAREKKETSEEKQYLIATGKLKEGPSWQVFMEERQKKEKSK